MGAVSNIATVTILVTETSMTPRRLLMTLNNTVNEDENISINLTDNDIDLDGTIDVNQYCLLALNLLMEWQWPLSNGTVTYTPNPDFNGSETFNYTVLDNDGALSNAALVSITVNDINDPPVAVNDNATTEEDTPVDIDVLSNDNDIDGTLVPSSLTIFSNPRKWNCSDKLWGHFYVYPGH